MHAAAAAEGLTLAPRVSGRGKSHDEAQAPFHANLRHGGRSNHLGTFATAEEAARRRSSSAGGAAVPRRPSEPAAERLKFQRVS